MHPDRTQADSVQSKSKSKHWDSPLPRRDFLKRLSLFGLLPLSQLFGCGSKSTALGSGGTPGTTPESGISFASFAQGGTASMVEKANYPDPFAGSLGECFSLTATTEGPCTTSLNLVREDISEGWGGLPVRILLKVVNSSCQAIRGATVKVWHTNFEGSYSGETPNNGMCLQDQSYNVQNFFRGVQTSDANGVVGFDTCFPGWYRGRAVHVHFQITTESTSSVVSQLFFPEDMTEAIFASHPEYAGFGQPDTVFSNDNIFAGIPSSQWANHVFEVSQMSDGAILASKAIELG